MVTDCTGSVDRGTAVGRGCTAWRFNDVVAEADDPSEQELASAVSFSVTWLIRYAAMISAYSLQVARRG